MEKTKCPNCGEMVEPKVYPLGYGYSAVCTSCGYTTQEEFSKEAALRRFGVSRVFHANKVEAALNCFKEKSSKAYKKKEENSMEKIKCPSCGEMVEPEVKLVEEDYNDDYLVYIGYYVCSCPNCGATTNRSSSRSRTVKMFKEGAFEDMKTKKKDQPQLDMVNHPNHYINENGVECQTVIDYVLSNIDVTKTAAYWLGCSIKYLFRYKRKGKPIQDLSKARVCFDRAIEYLKKDVENTN